MKSQEEYLIFLSKNKKQSLFLADIYEKLGYYKQYYTVRECGTCIEFRKCKETGEVTISGANFCKNRLCPQCAKRRSLKDFSLLSKVLNRITEKDKYKFLFVTLTLKNCEYNELSNTLDNISKAFSKFIDCRFFRGKNKQFLGCFKSVEITINTITRTFHPHLHLLVAVDKFYFSKHNNFYVKNEDIITEWKNCLNVDYLPVCDIRAVRNINKVKCEVSKYICKASDYLFYDDIKKSCELVEILSKHLFNRRFISYTGIFGKYRKLVKHDDDINIDEIDENPQLNYIFSTYKWNIGFSFYSKINI